MSAYVFIHPDYVKYANDYLFTHINVQMVYIQSSIYCVLTITIHYIWPQVVFRLKLTYCFCCLLLKWSQSRCACSQKKVPSLVCHKAQSHTLHSFTTAWLIFKCEQEMRAGRRSVFQFENLEWDHKQDTYVLYMRC